jgi:membrane protease YdiL (CAAX protease family)
VRSVLFLGAYLLIHAAVGVTFGLLSFLVDDSRFGPGGLTSANEILLLAIAVSALPLVGVTWLFVRFLDKRTLASIGARWPQGGRRVARRQLATVPLWTLALLLAWLRLILFLPSSLATVRLDGLDPGFAAGPPWWPFSPLLLLAWLFLGFLVQGGLEEWVVRGYVYHALKERWRPWTAALASSVLFSLLHAANPEVSAVALFNVLLAGMLLAGLVERSGSLWSAALAHGVWNFSVACLFSLPISGVRMFDLLDLSIAGDETLTGGDFGPEGSLLLTLLGLGLTAALWRRIGWQRPRREIAPSALEDGSRPASSGEAME